MRTESTLIRGPMLDELDPAVLPVAVLPVAVLPVAVLPDVLAVPVLGDEDEDELSSVPVTSTLWPTWGLSLDESASSRYVLPLAPAALGIVPPAVPAVVPPAVVPPAVVPDVVVPLVVVPVDADEPDEDDIVAFVRMKSLELDPLVLPLVPVAPEVALEPR